MLSSPLPQDPPSLHWGCREGGKTMFNFPSSATIVKTSILKRVPETPICPDLWLHSCQEVQSVWFAVN